MAKQENQATTVKRVVRKKSSPYAPMLKLTYRTILGLAIAALIWMGYEAFNTARSGIKQHDQQQRDYREAIGEKEGVSPSEDSGEESSESEENGN